LALIFKFLNDFVSFNIKTIKLVQNTVFYDELIVRRKLPGYFHFPGAGAATHERKRVKLQYFPFLCRNLCCMAVYLDAIYSGLVINPRGPIPTWAQANFKPRKYNKNSTRLYIKRPNFVYAFKKALMHSATKTAGILSTFFKWF